MKKLLTAAFVVSFAATSAFGGSWNSGSSPSWEISRVQTVTDKKLHGGIGWGDKVVRSLSDTEWGYSVVNENQERFEIRDGDCGNDKNHSDCATGRERSELSVSKKLKSKFDISYEIRFSEDYQSVSPSTTYLGQLYVAMKNKGVGHSPAFAFEEYKGTMRSYGTDLFKIDDQWHKIQIKGDMKTGDFQVFVDGEMKIESVLFLSDSASHLYWKYGIYRNAITDYKRSISGSTDYDVYKEVKLPTQVVFYRNLNIK